MAFWINLAVLYLCYIHFNRTKCSPVFYNLLEIAVLFSSSSSAVLKRRA